MATTNQARVYRLRATDPRTYFDEAAGAWFCSGVAYIGARQSMPSGSFTATEVGQNHDPQTDDIPAWYRAAVETLGGPAGPGMDLAEPRVVDEADAIVFRVRSPHTATYCDTNEGHGLDSVWFVEGVTYLRPDHPRLPYCRTVYQVEPVDRAPAWWVSAFTALRSGPAFALSAVDGVA